ncbi:MAG TPA: hypothetical protein VK694_05760 [Verrucomicrobiae bacterium]|nr:hypothetical protein [Verrucomicrobiae bacterium]
MGSTYNPELAEERPDFGSDQLAAEDLEVGMVVELVMDDEAVRTMAVLAVGKRYRDPADPTGQARRQTYMGDPRSKQLEVIDEPDWVIVAEKWDISRLTKKTSPPELMPVSLEFDALGLGPYRTEKLKGWHTDRYVRRVPGMQLVLLGVVIATVPPVKEQSGPRALAPV